MEAAILYAFDTIHKDRTGIELTETKTEEFNMLGAQTGQISAMI